MLLIAPADVDIKGWPHLFNSPESYGTNSGNNICFKPGNLSHRKIISGLTEIENVYVSTAKE